MALPGYMQDMAKVYGAALPNATRNDMLGAVGLQQFQSDDEKKKREEQQRQMAEDAAAGMKKGGKVKSASKRADGIAQRGKTKGRIV